jgi:hypothetical protein
MSPATIAAKGYVSVSDMAPKNTYRGIARPSQGCGLLGSFPQLLKAVQKGDYRCVVHNRDGMGNLLLWGGMYSGRQCLECWH